MLVDKFEERAKETLALIEDEGGEATIVIADLAEIAGVPDGRRRGRRRVTAASTSS